MVNNDNLIKIKEDAIKIQEADIADAIRSIENENTKSSFVLGFAAVLFGIVFDKMDKIQQEIMLVFLLLVVLSVIFALWNISAKKIKIHTNVDEIFVKNKPDNWKNILIINTCDCEKSIMKQVNFYIKKHQ
ncbi:MAG: hypothetical protein NC913_06315 [Candidatus Omnitrophica bacterium]|nr:hypothetical protein [Candidatus Omnitrophota bacterium]